MGEVIEIRQSVEEGHGYALLYREDGGEIVAVSGPFEVEQDKPRTSWRLFVNALDEDDWNSATDVVEWANEHKWGPAIYVDEEPFVEEDDLP